MKGQINPDSLLRKALNNFESDYIQRALRRNRWNRYQTARELGLSYRGLLYKIERHHLSPPSIEEAVPA